MLIDGGLNQTHRSTWMYTKANWMKRDIDASVRGASAVVVGIASPLCADCSRRVCDHKKRCTVHDGRFLVHKLAPDSVDNTQRMLLGWNIACWCARHHSTTHLRHCVCVCRPFATINFALFLTHNVFHIWLNKSSGLKLAKYLQSAQWHTSTVKIIFFERVVTSAENLRAHAPTPQPPPLARSIMFCRALLLLAG